MCVVINILFLLLVSYSLLRFFLLKVMLCGKV